MIEGETGGVGFSFRDVVLNGVGHQSEGGQGGGKRVTGLTCVEGYLGKKAEGERGRKEGER